MAIFSAFQEGGPFMYVILAFGLFSLTFIVERYSALYLKYVATPSTFREQIATLINTGNFKAAEKLALQLKNGLGTIVATGCALKADGASEEEVQARMDEALSQQMCKLDQKTGFLAMFGNVATLVGLLGTISGMIHSFAAVATASPMDRATLLSKGISEAMNCTAFGLIVAVPALVAFAIYQNRTDKIVTEMTNHTTEIFHDLLFKVDHTRSARSTGKAIANHMPDMSL